MPKTPPSSIKISTADQIENSVEKLRNLNLCEKETGARVAKKSRQQLNFSTELEHAYSQQNVIKMQHEEEDQVLLNDHEYSIPNKALETSEKVAEDFIKEAVSINTSINSYNSHDSLDKQLLSVCKLGKSVLFKSSAKDLSERNWFLDIGREMLQHCPEFLSLLLSAIGDKITAESKLATVCTIYGMLMHCRNTRASAIQKLYTSFLYQISYRQQDITFDRVKVSHLSNSTPIGNTETVALKEMIPSLEEDALYKNALKVILSRVIVNYCESFNWMKPIIPKHIQHPLQEVMSQKSSIHWLPIMLKNEAKYADCVQIMASYEDHLSTWYRKAGRGGDLDNLQVPKMYKRFFKTDSGRDKGTLYSLKLLIQRSNVNGKVKSRFEAHEDFALTVGCAYFLNFIMQHFKMKDLADTPSHPKMQKNIKMMHNHHKKELWSTLMNDIVDELVETFPKQAAPVKLQVEIYGQVFLYKSQQQGNMLAFELFIGDRKYIINITHEQAAAGAKTLLK
ncbi:unnamed protein product [Mytilus coruscus]|uniref:Uncharacterized protein n=1 Tax=Mytilus coruscus TaxID=42192 RepID=A0A6J8CCM6_MYTCO|nr:unnamed protein product [Mytilus coruscus]